ncbi:MAG: nicotinate-nucleotide diphosphorylase (carboxylating) [Bacteroidetes bacterium HGW-Bacteroidetes-1]|jgi:nicotinate-nucleotide pyrophosphorylase (carboxylating)|nr:MAG: nicotinate-nucleotide diphosphorylase (carboxylating) [Bacteroidetes bacterium HGW-Bacteroidetes-1]
MTDFPQVELLIRQAIIEDLGDGDHTSLATIPAAARGKAKLLIKEEGILAGVQVARMVFNQIDKELIFKSFLEDGQLVYNGDIAFEVEGKSQSILTAERLVLNFMQRMSGIATHTHKLVQLLDGLPARLLDTRKTTPNMRIFEKLAVRIGGGYNHRFGLFDMILIKNNHIDFAGGIEQALKRTIIYLEQNNKKLKIEIEVRNFDELKQVIAFGKVDRIMLDNFSTKDMNKAVEMIAGRFEAEASGGITESNLRQYAETGVDYISVGALTHHVKSLDMSLRAI